jgi:N-acetylglucosamine-6-phosphate deacetylase
VTVELIADGVHVHPAMVNATIEAAGADRVALVTDATAAAGVGDGEFHLGTVAVDVVQGVARVRGTSTIAGSTATMDQLFGAVAGHGSDRDTALAAAVRMTSTTAARTLGVDDAGSLRAGAKANLVVLEPDHRVRSVMARGSWVAGR